MNESELKAILLEVAQLEQIKNPKVTLHPAVSKTEGFLSELYTGQVKNKENGELLAIAIKKAPTEAGIFSNLTDFYQNENEFYSKVVPELNKLQQKMRTNFNQIPHYYLGNLNHVTMKNIIVEGYQLANKSEFFNKHQLELAFKVLGNFHALSFAFKDEHLNDYKRILQNVINVFQNKTEEDPVYQAIAANVVAGLKAFDPIEDKDVWGHLKKIEKVLMLLPVINNYKGKYKCIIHGDCWSNNLLFKYEENGLHPTDMKLIDFQMIRESTPVHDLAFLFYSSASEEELAYLQHYLQIYYDCFSRFAQRLGSDPNVIFPFEALKEDWQRYGLMGVFFAFDLLTLKLVAPEKALEMRNLEETNKELGMRMWEDEFVKIRCSEVFLKRAKILILQAIKDNDTKYY